MPDDGVRVRARYCLSAEPEGVAREGHMIGAALVIVLAGLLLPISLLLLAVVFDLLVLLWAAIEVMRQDVWPGVKRFAVAHHMALHWPRLRLRHH